MSGRVGVPSFDDDEFESLVLADPAMRRFTLAFARRVRDLRGFALGLYAEALVAELLGVHLAPGGTDNADLVWVSNNGQTVTIQVRSCNLTNSSPRSKGTFSIGRPAVGRRSLDQRHRRDLGEVWVFAAFDGPDYRTDWRFLLESAAELDEQFGDRQSCALSKLGPPHEWVRATELASVLTSLVPGLPGRLG